MPRQWKTPKEVICSKSTELPKLQTLPFTSEQIADEIYRQLWQECQARRRRLCASLEVLDRRHEQHVTSLDAAIRIIAKVGLLYKSLIRSDQRELLRLMVERVVVKPEEKVRLELRAPFAYFNEVSQLVQHGDQPGMITK